MVHFFAHPRQRHFQQKRNETPAPFPVHHQLGRFRQFGDSLGLLLAGKERDIRVFRFIRASTAFGMGRRHAGARGKTFLQKRQPDPMGTERAVRVLLPALFERKKQRHQLRRHFENVQRRSSSKRARAQGIVFVRYTP